MAPSWSWASLYDGTTSLTPNAVMSHQHHWVRSPERDAVFLRADLVPTRAHHAEGQLSSGLVHLRGFVRVVTLPFSTEPLGLHEPLNLAEPVNGLTAHAHLDPDAIIEEQERRKSVTGPQVYVAFVVLQWNVVYHDTSAYLHGLLLAAAGTGVHYVRKGIFSMQPGNRDAKELESILRDAGYKKIDPRKKDFDGTWDGWKEQTVIIE